MIRRTGLAALLALAMMQAVPAWAQFPMAQISAIPALAGGRLDISATGEVSRIPDIVRIQTGVDTQAGNAGDAMRQNSARMARIRAALAAAGIADRDIQTTSFDLSPAYRTASGGRSERAGFRATNRISIRLRDVTNSGLVIDALASEGVQDIDGPTLDFENRETLLDEARTQAIATARARADLYARGLGTRVKRVVLVTEQADRGGGQVANLNTNSMVGSTIDTGGRTLSATVNVIFELE